jgi:hypothetical protein
VTGYSKAEEAHVTEASGRLAARAVVVLMIPVLFVLGFDGLPSMKTVLDAQTFDTIGVWMFSWGLIWIAVVAALGILWAAWSWDLENARSEREKPRTAA